MGQVEIERLLEESAVEDIELEAEALRTNLDLQPVPQETPAERLARLEREIRKRHETRQDGRIRGLMLFCFGDDKKRLAGVNDVMVVLMGRDGSPESPAGGSALDRVDRMWESYSRLTWLWGLAGTFGLLNGGALVYVLTQMSGGSP